MKTILVIEDDTSLSQAYQEMFRSQDVSVVTAKTGQEGLSLIQTTQPDLILLDIMLPGGINGFDVLEKLKADSTTQSIPVIVLTNLDSQAKTATTVGAAGYLIKANSTKDQIVKLVMGHLR